MLARGLIREIRDQRGALHLPARRDLLRAALIGRIYLVTVVALIVSNMGPGRRRTGS